MPRCQKSVFFLGPCLFFCWKNIDTQNVLLYSCYSVLCTVYNVHVVPQRAKSAKTPIKPMQSISTIAGRSGNSDYFNSQQGKWDPINSTYKHIIKLKNGKELPGYSKGRGVPEMQDKDTLIQKVIIRLFKNGYLNDLSANTWRETNSIVFYMNDPIYPEKIATLYHDKYVLEPEQIDNTTLISFLNRFYASKLSGKESKNLVKEPRKSSYLDEKREFKCEDSLQNYVEKKLMEGRVARQIVVNFYRRKLAQIQERNLGTDQLN